MWKIGLIPLLLIVGVLVWRFLNWVWLKPRKMEAFLRKQGMKGNSYRFLVGDSKETSLMYEKAFSKPIGLNDDIVPRLMPNILHALQKYGNYSFTWSGPSPRIFIHDVDVARDVLSKHLLYHKNFKISNEIIKLLCTGIANKEGDEWTKSKSRVSPLFRVDKLKTTVHSIQMCSEDTLNEWKKMAPEGGESFVIDVFPHLEIFTSSVLAQLMFTSAYTDELKRTFLQLGELANLGRMASKVLEIPGEKYLPTRVNRRAKEIDKYVRNSFASMINERLKRESGAHRGRRDMLDVFMEELYEGNFTTRSERQKIIEDIVGECKIFFFSGFETSSNMLTWTLITLSSHQDWQARAREEVFQVLGDRKDITSDDLDKLKIVTMIINEMLRLYPPVMEVSRLFNEDTNIKGRVIPKDSRVTFPILMYHRNKKIWGEDAGEFRPDRFAEGAMKAANGEAAFMPFGWGPRMCVGMNFAMLEMKVFLALLLRSFSFELSPTYTHAPIVNLTIQPQFGAPIVFKKL